MLFEKLVKYEFIQNNQKTSFKAIDYSIAGDNLAPYIRLQYGIKQLLSPTKVQFLLTCRCFGDCTFCLTNSSITSNLQELTDVQWEELTNRFYQEMHPCQLDLIGGEPLLRFEAVLKICKTASKYNTMVRIITNGVVLADYEKCLKLSTVLKDMRHYIQLSVDGNESVHNEIRKGAKLKDILTAAKNLHLAGLTWGLNVTVMKKNKDQLNEILDLFGLYKPIHFEIGPLQTSTKDAKFCEEMMLTEQQEEEVHKTVLFLSKKNPDIDFVYNKRVPIYKSNIKPKGASRLIQDSCSAFYKLMSILPDGRLIPCLRGCVHPEFYGENVYDSDSILTLWRNSRLKRLFNDIPLSNRCVSCDFNTQCNQGCPLETYVQTRDLGGYNPNCEYEVPIIKEF